MFCTEPVILLILCSDEARRLFSKTPFFAAWDPASLDVYVDFGLYSDVKNGKPVVRLKMPGLTVRRN